MALLPTLTTERLLLRPCLPTDAPAIQRLASERAIADTTLNLPHPFPEDGAATWIAGHPARRENGDYAFAVVRRQDTVLVGIVSLGLNPPHNKAELGYWIGTPYWNLGYATEAVRRVLQWGFEEMGLNRIYARYLGRNPASGRVMEKAGLRYEGFFRQDVLKGDVYEDLGQYGLTRDEYPGPEPSEGSQG